MWKENAKYAKLGKLTPPNKPQYSYKEQMQGHDTRLGGCTFLFADFSGGAWTWWCRFVPSLVCAVSFLVRSHLCPKHLCVKKVPTWQVQSDKPTWRLSQKWRVVGQQLTHQIIKVQNCGEKIRNQLLFAGGFLLLKFNFVMEKKPDKHKKTWFVRRYKTVE